MTSTSGPQFTPRLASSAGRAPYNPGSYFLLALFGGALALALISTLNLDRVTKVEGLRTKTYLVLAAMVAAAFVFLAVSPASWWESLGTIRLGMRLVAVAAGAVLYGLHKGPAIGTLQRHDKYASMWKSIGYIIAAALIQGLLIVVFGWTRGVP